jgi:hypothetical protein
LGAGHPLPILRPLRSGLFSFSGLWYIFNQIYVLDAWLLGEWVPPDRGGACSAGFIIVVFVMKCSAVCWINKPVRFFRIACVNTCYSGYFISGNILAFI